LCARDETDYEGAKSQAFVHVKREYGKSEADDEKGDENHRDDW
jgi:hypothetical protein